MRMPPAMPAQNQLRMEIPPSELTLHYRRLHAAIPFYAIVQCGMARSFALLEVRRGFYAIAQGSRGLTMTDGGKGRRRFRSIHLLLLPPYIAVLWVPFYNSAEPALYGVPFFYWYQMLWILLGVV